MNIQTPDDSRLFRSQPREATAKSAKVTKVVVFHTLIIVTALVTYWLAYRYPLLSRNARLAACALLLSGLVLLVWTTLTTRKAERRRTAVAGVTDVLFVLGVIALMLAYPLR